MLRLKLNDGTYIYDAHADAAPLGRNMASLVQKVRASAGTAPWMMMGDFNVEPRYVRPMLGDVSPPQLVTPKEATHGDNEFDYMVTSGESGYTAKKLEDFTSDHSTVRFRK